MSGTVLYATNGATKTHMTTSKAAAAAEALQPVQAGLWALAAYDPTLVHFVELRQWAHHKNINGSDPIYLLLENTLATYLNWQCQQLRADANLHTTPTTVVEEFITRSNKFDALIDERLGAAEVARTGMHIVDISREGLLLELLNYALCLGTLSNHGKAPFHRFAAVMADCFAAKHPHIKLL